MTEKSTSRKTIKRRPYLVALSSAAATSWAGCIGDDDDGAPTDDDGTPTDPDALGDRVPELTITVLGGLATSGTMEVTASHVKDVLEELGVPAEVEVREFLTAYSELQGDARNWNLHIDYHALNPFYLDPDRLLVDISLPYAGSNSQGNPAQYASCEYTELFQEQRETTDPEERRSIIHEAEGVASDDIFFITLLSQTNMGAYRSDQVEMPDLGEGGISRMNYDSLVWDSRPVGDHDKISYVPPSTVESVVYHTGIGIDIWSHGVYSSLAGFDKNYEFIPQLATDWDIEDDGSRFTFYLREDATFHNGAPVTAEDVKWTYEFIEDNVGTMRLASSWDYESIEAVDDHTVEINFPGPTAHFLRTHVSMWGILPHDIWIDAGAEEDAVDVDIEPDDIVGSGPYEVVRFRPEEILDLQPYDDHWLDVEGNLVLRAFHDMESARRAMVQGEINMVPNADAGTVEIIEDELPDVGVVDRRPAFMPWWLVPQTHFGPTKFVEFRRALSEAIDRSLLNEMMEHGHSEPQLYSTNLAPPHPFYPEDPDEVLNRIAESPTGDISRARDILSDEGWGWDDNGQLHYPSDADLEPLWPEGSEPCEHPEIFPCVDDVC